MLNLIVHFQQLHLMCQYLQLIFFISSTFLSNNFSHSSNVSGISLYESKKKTPSFVFNQSLYLSLEHSKLTFFFFKSSLIEVFPFLISVEGKK